jgi:hypothetical protein
MVFNRFERFTVLLSPRLCRGMSDYDDFIEKAYNMAHEKKLAEYQCVPIKRDSDLYDAAHVWQIPLYKLHGCITTTDKSQNAGAMANIVAAGRDYIIGYSANREYMFKSLELDGQPERRTA